MDVLEVTKIGISKAHSSVSVLVKLVLIVSIVYSLYFHSWRILFANLYLLILLFTPIFFKNKYKIILPKEFESAVLVFAIISFILGDSRGLIVQLFFGLLIGFIGFSTMVLLYARTTAHKDYLLIAIFSLSFSLAIGSSLEIAKFFIKNLLGYPPSISDYRYAIIGLTIIIFSSLLSILVGEIYITKHKFPILRKVVEKFKKKNPNFFIKKIDNKKDLLKLIKQGEDEKLEFKSTLRTNLHTGKEDKNIEYAVLKTITAFLNSRGGILLVGVSDSGEIVGIERDNFKNKDKLLLHFTNLVKKSLGKNAFKLIDAKIISVDGKSVLRIECRKSAKPIFLKWEGREDFFVRIGPATNSLVGNELVEYVKENF